MDFLNFFKNRKIQKDKRSADCPYCNEKLNKIPGSKTKCPYCCKFIYVRINPKNEIRLIVTKKQAEDIDHEWAIKNGLKSKNDKKDKIYELPWERGEKTPVNKFMTMVGEQCGISEQEVFNRRQKTTNINDAIWSLCNEYLLKNQKERNFDNLKSLYFYMEHVRFSQGKTTNQFTKRKLYFDLLQKKEDGNSLVIIMSSYDSCEACKKLDGKEFDIDEAIKNQPFPPKGCNCLRCSIIIS